MNKQPHNKAKHLLLFVLLACAQAQNALAGGYVNRRAGVLVTRAKIDDPSQNQTVALFSKALFYHPQDEAQRANPKKIGFALDEDNLTNTKINSRLDGERHLLNSEELVDLLVREVPELSGLGALEIPNPPESYSDFGPGRPISLLLQSKPENQNPESLTTYFRVDIGEPQEMKITHAKMNKDVMEIYKHHFQQVELEIKTTEDRPGYDTSVTLNTVSGVYLVKSKIGVLSTSHLFVYAAGGKREAGGAPNYQIPVSEMTESDKSYSFRVLADDFFKRILLPLTANKIQLACPPDETPNTPCSTDDQGRKVITFAISKTPQSFKFYCSGVNQPEINDYTVEVKLIADFEEPKEPTMDDNGYVRLKSILDVPKGTKKEEINPEDLRLGIFFVPKPKDPGAFIESVVPRTPAAGLLEPGWQVLSINGEPVANQEEARRIIDKSDNLLELEVLDPRGDGTSKDVQIMMRPKKQP